MNVIDAALVMMQIASGPLPAIPLPAVLRRTPAPVELPAPKVRRKGTAAQIKRRMLRRAGVERVDVNSPILPQLGY